MGGISEAALKPFAFRLSASVCRGSDSVRSRTWFVVLSGALCSTGAASSALTGEIDSARAFACRSVMRARGLCRAVLNDDAGAFVRSFVRAVSQSVALY